MLRNLLKNSFDSPDSSKEIKFDSLYHDTLGRIRKFTYLPAKVVNSSISQEYNYITLYRGSKNGIKKDMPVVGPQGVVGRIIIVSENYSRVMSLLNRNSKVSAMLKKGNYAGILDWDGKDPNFLQFHGISKSAAVKKGDSVVTSNLSDFPEGILLGTIAAFSTDPGTNFYTLQIKSATNFFNLQYAYAIEKLYVARAKNLEALTPKKSMSLLLKKYHSFYSVYTGAGFCA